MSDNTSTDEPFDPRFSLPAVDDPAAVEVGVILLGLDGERLLAGLGLAALADDPATVTLLVDRLRHGAGPGIDLAGAVTAGIRRWRAARPALTGTAGSAAAVRTVWARACAAVADSGLADLGPASRAYLAACWLRQSEMDNYLEDPDAVPEVTA